MSRRAWLTLLAVLLGGAAVALLLNYWLQRGPRPPAAAAEQVSRFAPERPLTLACRHSPSALDKPPGIGRRHPRHPIFTYLRTFCRVAAT